MNKFKIFTGLLFFVIFYNCTLAQSIVWSHEGTVVYPADQVDMRKRYLIADKYDTLYTVRSTIGKSSESDITLYKYDNNGTLVWLRTYNSGYSDYTCGSLVMDYQNSIYIIGESDLPGRSAFVLLKYDRNGNLIWTRTQDSTSTRYYAMGMEQDQSGNLVVLCQRETYLTPSTTRIEYYVLKYDLNGTLLWKSVFNATPMDSPREICIAGDNICVTGEGDWYSGRSLCATGLNSNGMILWQHTSSLYNTTGSRVNMPVITDGTYFYVGTNIFSGANSYIEVKKFGSWGAVPWTFINDSVSSVRSLEYDYVNQRIVVGGYIRSGSNYNLYCAEINSNTGAKVWGQRFTGSGYINGRVNDIKVRYINGSFNIYLLGNVSMSGGSSDFALLKYTTSGGLVWSTFYNGSHSSNDHALTLACGGLFDFYITGDCSDGAPYPSTIYNYALIRVSSTLSSPITQVNTPDNLTSYPDHYSLEQNYPNPFNPSTTIKFTLPVEDNVVLNVSDITGKVVTELIDQKMTAGYHEIKFDGSNLSSGVYFYKITSSKFTDVKKMILVK